MPLRRLTDDNSGGSLPRRRMRRFFGCAIFLMSAGCSNLIGPGAFSFSATRPGFASPSDFASVTKVVVVVHAIPGTGWPTRTLADTSVIVP